jgi:flagellar hook-basal body complex protein FliE
MVVDKPFAAGLDAQLTPNAKDSGTPSLGDTFGRMFNEVNRMQVNADSKIEEFATSPNKDIHGTMIALQEADISLRLMLQIRSKLTAAYQDVMRMQL